MGSFFVPKTRLIGLLKHEKTKAVWRKAGLDIFFFFS